METPGLSLDEIREHTPRWNREVLAKLSEFMDEASSQGLKSESPEKDNRFLSHCQKHPNQDHDSVANGVCKIYNRYYSAALRSGGYADDGEYWTILEPIFNKIKYQPPLG